jgi:predicted P-loop ATPase
MVLEVYDPGFQHPFTCIVEGPAMSGKSMFVKKLLQYSPVLIHPPSQKI